MTPEREAYVGINLIVGIVLCGLLTMPVAALLFGFPITRRGGLIVWLLIVAGLVVAHVLNRREYLRLRNQRRRAQRSSGTPGFTLVDEEAA